MMDSAWDPREPIFPWATLTITITWHISLDHANNHSNSGLHLNGQLSVVVLGRFALPRLALPCLALPCLALPWCCGRGQYM